MNLPLFDLSALNNNFWKSAVVSVTRPMIQMANPSIYKTPIILLSPFCGYFSVRKEYTGPAVRVTQSPCMNQDMKNLIADFLIVTNLLSWPDLSIL